MAHYLEYKSPSERLPYEFDFTDDLTDTQLDLVPCQEALKVTDSAGVDKKAFLIQSIERTLKVLTVVLANGLDGEDYTIIARGIGETSHLTRQPVRVLELRVRNKLLGNL